MYKKALGKALKSDAEGRKDYFLDVIRIICLGTVL